MSVTTTGERLALKTPEAAFLDVLEREFHFSPRVTPNTRPRRRAINTAWCEPTGRTRCFHLKPASVRFACSRARVAQPQLTLALADVNEIRYHLSMNKCQRETLDRILQWRVTVSGACGDSETLSSVGARLCKPKSATKGEQQ
jgi:hypothetical protein